MTDVEAKTPTKRRLPDKKEKGPVSAKKAKVTPEKKNKNLNTPNIIQNSNENLKKKNKKNSQAENGSAKKLKPFVGTSETVTSNEKPEGSKKVTKLNEEKSERKRRRRGAFILLKSKINSDEKESALQSIEDKIKAIESRDTLSKSAKRKLKMLHRLKRIATGEKAAQPQQQKIASQKSKSKGQQEAKKKGLEASKGLQPKLGKQEVMKMQAKVGQKKADEVNKKQVKVDNKQLAKKGKQQLKLVKAEESSDEDEESDELDEDEEASDEEVEEEENGLEGESDDESGDEEGEEEESDEEGEEEEEDSDTDESEESPPQVSNKKQKKK